MKPNYDKTIARLLDEIRAMAKDLPNGKAHMIHNRCDKLAVTLRKTTTPDNSITGEGENQGTNGKAMAQIYAALMAGRHLSQMNCKEFRVEDMRTPVSHLAGKIAKSGHVTRSRWIDSPFGRKVKEYWLEELETPCEL